MATYTFTTLDNPIDPYPNSFDTFPSGINNLGQISGSVGYADVGFIYNAGSYSTIVSFNSGGVGGINDQGQVVWFSINSSYDYFNGFLYSGGTNTPIGDPLAASAFNFTVPVGINDASQIVGYYYDISSTGHGFFYDGSTYTTIDDPLGWWSAPLGINNTGQIVGNYLENTAAETSHGFLYSGGTYTTIDDPLGTAGTVAYGINDAGEIVGYYIDSNGFSHGFLYSNGTYTTIDDPYAIGSDGGTIISGINNAGQIVGHYGTDNGYHGFLASPNQSQPPTVSSITAVTDNGEKELNAGRVVTITVNTSEIVNVTGTPTLQLHNNETATYAGGTGTNALTFTYTVQQGDDISDLQVIGLLPNGATVQDGAGNSLSGPVAQDLTLQIDTTPPMVSSITAVTDNGENDLNAGRVVTITVNTSEIVNVTGAPTLQLNNNELATYVGGTGSSALIFTYKVLPGDDTADLQVIGDDF